METPAPKENERPDLVWVLLILYSLGVVINFAAIMLVTLSHRGHSDPVALGISLVVMAVRGVGLVKLLLLKNHAWIYLSVALLIIVASDALDLMFGGADFFLQRHAPLKIVGGYAVAVAVITYAYRIGNKQALPK